MKKENQTNFSMKPEKQRKVQKSAQIGERRKEAESREPSKEDGIKIRFGREGRNDESHDRQYRVSTV